MTLLGFLPEDQLYCRWRAFQWKHRCCPFSPFSLPLPSGGILLLPQVQILLFLTILYFGWSIRNVDRIMSSLVWGWEQIREEVGGGGHSGGQFLCNPCILRGPQQRGTKSEVATSPLPSRGPKRGGKCDIAPAFSGVPNKGHKIRSGHLTDIQITQSISFSLTRMQGLQSNSALLWAPEKARVR